MGRYSVIRKNKNTREVHAVDWLEQHPEDIPMARENLLARDKGFDNDAVRDLFAAISLRACIDYKLASKGVRVGNRDPKCTMEDCHKFFGGDIFQYLINRIRVEDVERMIKETPDGAISSLAKTIK